MGRLHHIALNLLLYAQQLQSNIKDYAIFCSHSYV